jgi:hypothetical protein
MTFGRAEGVMPKLTMVIGLPGSGKSRYTDEHAKGGVKGFSDVMSPSGRRPNKVEAVALALQGGQDVIGDDVSWCEEQRRNDFIGHIKAMVPNVEIEFVYFEASPQKCGMNLMIDFMGNTRTDLEVRAGELRRLAGLYRVPAGFKPERVWIDPEFMKKLID